MTKPEAHRLLDAAQRGEPVTQLQIIEALRATGDMAPMRLCGRSEDAGHAVPEMESA
jgi:hypothetical protein